MPAHCSPENSHHCRRPAPAKGPRGLSTVVLLTVPRQREAIDAEPLVRYHSTRVILVPQSEAACGRVSRCHEVSAPSAVRGSALSSGLTVKAAAVSTSILSSQAASAPNGGGSTQQAAERRTGRSGMTSKTSRPTSITQIIGDPSVRTVQDDTTIRNQL